MISTRLIKKIGPSSTKEEIHKTLLFYKTQLFLFNSTKDPKKYSQKRLYRKYIAELNRRLNEL